MTTRLAYARATGTTSYHPVGTCRMGTDVDAVEMTQHVARAGIAGLRVAEVDHADVAIVEHQRSVHSDRLARGRSAKPEASTAQIGGR